MTRLFCPPQNTLVFPGQANMHFELSSFFAGLVVVPHPLRAKFGQERKVQRDDTYSIAVLTPYLRQSSQLFHTSKRKVRGCCCIHGNLARNRRVLGKVESCLYSSRCSRNAHIRQRSFFRTKKVKRIFLPVASRECPFAHVWSKGGISLAWNISICPKAKTANATTVLSRIARTYFVTIPGRSVR